MNHRLVRLGLLTLLLVGFPSLTAQERSQPAWSTAIEPLPSPAGANSGQPQLSASARGVILSWIERDGRNATLRYAERTPTGWSSPRTVASGNDWFVNWADVPSVVRLANGTLVGHWLQKSGTDTYAYDVKLSYSKDDGKTWSPSFMPHSDGTKTEHGFASLFQRRVGVELTANGSAIASWIEFADEGAQFRVRRVERSGARSPSVTISGLAAGRASGFPRIASTADEVIFAWTENAKGGSVVKTAVAPLRKLSAAAIPRTAPR
jgi:hypothetical protein